MYTLFLILSTCNLSILSCCSLCYSLLFFNIQISKIYLFLIEVSPLLQTGWKKITGNDIKLVFFTIEYKIPKFTTSTVTIISVVML